MATTKMKRMTGNDVRGLREGLDMTTVEFGKLLGLGPSAVTRWESKKAKAVSMDPFAARVAEIIVGQSKKLGKTKFGAIVRDALAHEHDLFALWQILSLAFGEGARIAKKIVGGSGKGKAKRAEKRQGRRAAKKDGVQAHGRRAVSRHASKRRAKRAAPRRAARRVPRAKPAKAKSAPRARPAPKAASKPAVGVPGAESKITASAHKERAEAATVGTNGIPQ